MTTLNTKATNEGTYVITCSFTDADGTASTPTSLMWSLTNDTGIIINSRNDVNISPSSTVNIVLTDSDIDTNDGTGRIFTIEGTYNSSTYGNNLPVKGQAKFVIDKWYDKS